MTKPPAAPQYYWEDLPVGHTQEVGSTTLTREQVLDFARQFDPQPFHLDEAAAAEGVFGRLSASGWHTCAACMGLMVRHFFSKAAALGSPGLERVEWRKPVFPGDTLRLVHVVTDSRPSQSRPGVGLVRARWDVFNQHGDQVLMVDAWVMFRRRTPAAGVA